MNIVYLNGELVPQSEAKVSAFDAGFLYGFGAFETMRAYNGVIFRLERHMQRLGKAVELMGIEDHLDTGKIEKACYKVLEANEMQNARIRVSVTAGKTGIPHVSKPSKFTVLAFAQDIAYLSDRIYTQGYKAIISGFKRYSKSILAGVKTCCYLENMLAREEALRQKADEALFLNERGFITEGTVSNLFIVEKDVVLTPSLRSGALPGITREVIMDLSADIGLDCSEGKVSVKRLMVADEAFLTNSIIEIVPLVKVSASAIGAGKPGPIAGKLLSAYRKIISNEIPHL